MGCSNKIKLHKLLAGLNGDRPFSTSFYTVYCRHYDKTNSAGTKLLYIPNVALDLLGFNILSYLS